MFADDVSRAEDLFTGQAALPRLSLDHNIVHRDDALKSPVIVDDGQAQHLFALHGLDGGFDVVIRMAGVDRARHHLAHGDLRGEPVLRRDGHADVAVGDHTDHLTLVVNYRQRAAIVIPQQAGGGGQIGVGAARGHIRGHDVLNFHVYFPFSFDV